MTKRALLLFAGLVLSGTSAAQGQGVTTMVSGRIFDDITSCPLRGVVLTASGSAVRTQTDAQGRYWFKGVPATAFTLQAALPGYQSQSADNVVATDTATRVDFSLERAPTDSSTKVRVRYPTMKCILDRRDSGMVEMRRR